MLFNSFEYVLFFLTILALGWSLRHHRSLRILVLLGASYYFYVSNNSWLIVLILVSTQIDFLCALQLSKTGNDLVRKRWLALSIASNLSILGFFKYFNFFMASVSSGLGLMNISVPWTNWDIALPVGISFYTFQSMSYTIDVYRGIIPVERSWARFAMFVAFFPQLVAGPIVRARDFIPQIGKKLEISLDDLRSGIYLVVRGLFRKVVLADFLAIYADAAFTSPDTIGWAQAWIGLYAFTFQIYFDFTGYSDIAIGCARLMGFKIPDNFNLPYMATSFSDFWRRWHISLSSWLRDYLYIPLGGSQNAKVSRTYFNLMVTMLLGGLWHGAAWHFVLWGFLHGLFLAIERVFGVERFNAPEESCHGGGMWFRRLIVFHGVVLTWLLFRCETNWHLMEYFKALARPAIFEAITYGHLAAIVVVVAGWLVQGISLTRSPGRTFLRFPVPIQSFVYAASVIIILIFGAGPSVPFIYFRF